MFGKRNKSKRFRVFFATDIHGSDRCFRKFLAGAKVYEADALILGGDIVGKGFVPITEKDDGTYGAHVHGKATVVTEGELDALREGIEFMGLYPVVVDERRAAALAADPAARDAVFEAEMHRQVAGWVTLAGERLEGIRCLITPGNDDPRSIDEILRAGAESGAIECPEHEIAELGPIQVASMGDTNRTPWDTDREYDESDLAKLIEEILDGADDERLVLNFHCPPYDTGLDTAAKLDDSLTPVVSGGAVVEIPVGSTAVREAILAHRPPVGLHGHIHESGGTQMLGGSLCVNPGSEYSSGVLRGAIVDFDSDGRCQAHLLTSG